VQRHYLSIESMTLALPPTEDAPTWMSLRPVLRADLRNNAAAEEVTTLIEDEPSTTPGDELGRLHHYRRLDVTNPTDRKRTHVQECCRRANWQGVLAFLFPTSEARRSTQHAPAIAA
jgi:hypothetical protein